MKKYLMILSSIMAIGIGTVANTLNTQENNSKVNLDIQDCIAKSRDWFKYDLTKHDELINLPDLLYLFKELKEEREASKAKIQISNSFWYINDDNGDRFHYGFPDFKYIANLINANDTQFNKVEMEISKFEVKVYLIYQIADVELMIPIFDFHNQPMPLKQEQMLLSIEIERYYES